MLFNNLLLALALTVLWPLGLMGVLAAAEWLERRTLTAREIAPRRLRSPAGTPPEPVQAGTAEAAGVAGVAEADAGVPAASWAAPGRGAPGGAPGPGAFDGDADAADGERMAARRVVGGGRHLRRAGGGRHERRG
jgi:hypothetical protein